jgi:hypothetical protein
MIHNSYDVGWNKFDLRYLLLVLVLKQVFQFIRRAQTARLKLIEVAQDNNTRIWIFC